MTRLLTFCGLVLLAVGPAAADDKKEVPKELVPFQGTWKPIKATNDGAAAPADLLDKARGTIIGNKVTILLDKKELDTGTLTVDAKKDPTEIDFVNSKSEKGVGIYKIDKDGKLTVCLAVGKDAVRPKDFGGKAGILVVMEKVKE